MLRTFLPLLFACICLLTGCGTRTVSGHGPIFWHEGPQSGVDAVVPPMVAWSLGTEAPTTIFCEYAVLPARGVVLNAKTSDEVRLRAFCQLADLYAGGAHQALFDLAEHPAVLDSFCRMLTAPQTDRLAHWRLFSDLTCTQRMVPPEIVAQIGTSKRTWPLALAD